MNFEKEIQTVLISKHFLIYISTEEEERLEYILQQTINKMFKGKIYSWNFIDGYKDNPNYTYQCIQNPLEALNTITKYNNKRAKVFFLKDFHVFLQDISISRKLKNLYQYLNKSDQYVILSGTEVNIPIELKEYIVYIQMPLPNKKEILIELNRFLYKENTDKLKYRQAICVAYTGFSINKIRKSLSKLILNNISKNQIIEQILQEKEKIIQNTEGLKFYSSESNLVEVGGLQNLKNWLQIRNLAFTQIANSYGIKKPKGVLLVGIQGTGKSLSAKIISNEWNMPLFRLDVSKVFTGILGESENRIEKVINICEKSSPCILWIDEIDKIFSEYNTNNDSGTKQRVTNIFLTWLSEKKQEVFIVATANTIHQLPIEILRKGRFDEIFFVDLPNFKARLKIFQIHLKTYRPITWNKYNIYYLSKISKGFSGAEIEQSIIDAMYIGFYNKREFTTTDVKNAIKKIIPLSKIERKKILNLRKWGYSGKITIA
uniref:Uncharacterized AAA domain-containing protein ycf46 n=1 Tax=Symphyocladiella dendroidea TaxID=2506487 RepID=A0A1Z1M7N4_9FLOR|nr:hypothetical protein [Symphyocladiella dendroidea]ARW61775.1 hypothetical protein [Symphyocladiella dendroidea]